MRTDRDESEKFDPQSIYSTGHPKGRRLLMSIMTCIFAVETHRSGNTRPWNSKCHSRELNFITSNKNKLAEVQAILGEVIPLKNQSVDLTEIQGTIEEISKDKCQRAAEVVSLPVLRLQVSDTDFGYSEGGWACFDGRYMPMLQCFERAAWAIHVRI